MTQRMIARMTAPLARALGNMLARGVVLMVNPASKMQSLQVSLLSGEVKDGVEHFESYGLTANAKAGAEHVTLFFGGDRSHGVTLAVADRRYRLKGLASGEVALYDDLGHKVHLTRNGIVIDGAGHALNIVNVPDTYLSGVLHVESHINSGGNIVATGNVSDQGGAKSMAGMRTTYNGHTHSETGTTTASPTQQA